MPDRQPVAVPDFCPTCGEPISGNPWAPDQPLGKRLGAALDRQFPEITASTDPAVREAVEEKTDRIERAMTQIWDGLGLDDAIRLPESWEDDA